MRKTVSVVLSAAIACFVFGAAPAQAKSPVLAFGLSFLIPSSGQFYNGQIGKGFLVLGAEAAGAGLFAVGAAQTMVSGAVGKEENADAGSMAAGVGLMACGWIYSFIDAPVSANRINSRKSRSFELSLLKSDDYTGLALTQRF